MHVLAFLTRQTLCSFRLAGGMSVDRITNRFVDERLQKYSRGRAWLNNRP